MNKGDVLKLNSTLYDLPHKQESHENMIHIIANGVGLCGLRVMCSPRDTRFTGSNPTDVNEFFQGVKILSKSPPGGTLS